MPSASLAIIINPRSGAAGPEVARVRASRAAAFLTANGCDPSQVFVTERPGHARELAADAVARNVSTVVAWGGDGTANEVGSALAFTGTALGLVPGGSGNGLARQLAIPFQPEAALAVALGGREVVIDAGDVGGRYFFNVAGIGLDARVAHRFGKDAGGRRGLLGYASLAVRELWTASPEDVSITCGGVCTTKSVMLIVIANGAQYGAGAIIARTARLDDGQLDLVVFDVRSSVRAFLELPFLFTGHVTSLPGVTCQRMQSVEIAAANPIPYHLDGEAIGVTDRLRAEVRPKALRIRTP